MMKNNMELTLQNIQWGEFKIEKIFSVENCKCSKASIFRRGAEFLMLVPQIEIMEF